MTNLVIAYLRRKKVCYDFGFDNSCYRIGVTPVLLLHSDMLFEIKRDSNIKRFSEPLGPDSV